VGFIFEQVDELLQGTQQNETAALRPDEIERPQVNCANLTLKAQLREISLGQLVGAIVAGAASLPDPPEARPSVPVPTVGELRVIPVWSPPSSMRRSI